MQKQFLLHYLTLEIETSSERLFSWIENCYISYDQRAQFPGKESTYRFYFEELDSPEALTISLPQEGFLTEHTLGYGACYYHDGLFYSETHQDFSHEIIYDMNTRTIRANLGGRYLDGEENFIYNIFRPFLRNFLLPFHQLKTLHGALLSKGPQTVFLAGAGGMGKTTTTFQLLEAGFSLISEDSPFFVYDQGKAWALSSLDEPRVTDNTLELFPALKDHIKREKDISGKYAISRDFLPPEQLAYGPVQVTHFIQLNRGEFNTPVLTPLDKLTVLSQLLRESMVLFRHPHFQQPGTPFKPASDFVFKVITQMVQDAAVYRLDYGNHHLPDLPELIENLAGVRS